jgi:hypothetical protein
MQTLLSHWHCIVPALAIIAAMFLMREKPENKNEQRRIESE